jgi:hypothetical protein
MAVTVQSLSRALQAASAEWAALLRRRFGNVGCRSGRWCEATMSGLMRDSERSAPRLLLATSPMPGMVGAHGPADRGADRSM